MFKRPINQFLLTAILLSSLHFSHLITSPEPLTRVSSYYPLIIDSALPLFALCVLLAGKLALSKLPFSEGHLIIDLVGAVIFITLGISAVSVLVFYAYTGDRLNIDLMGYSLSHIHELFGPIVEESGYPILIAALTLLFLAIFLLHKAHKIDTKHLVLSLFLFPPTLLALSPFTSDLQNPPRFLTFYTPAKDPFQPHIEQDRNPTPPWFKSYYLTLVGRGHGSYKKFESSPPSNNYAAASFISQKGKKPNIIIIAMESVRADAVSPYSINPELRQLTPNLEELARSGLVIENAYTTVPHTSKALVGIFCGQFPRREMEIIEADPDGLPVSCMPKLLAKAGYKTAFFQSALGEFENRHGLKRNMGFGEIFTQEQLPHQNYKKLSYVGMDDYVMLDPSINWMLQHKKQNKPFFVGMLTVVSHHPYKTPKKWGNQKKGNSHFENYLNAVSYTDRFIGDLLKQMKQAGLLEDTIVIITGDHGEAFGDHGPSFHNSTPHEDGMKVPLLIYSPSVFPTPARISGLRSHLDLLPTVLELAGTNVSKDLPGKSLLSSKGHDALSGSCWYVNHCAIHYMSNGGKYIYWHGRKPNEYYNLNDDPGESKNMIRSLNSNEESILVRSTFALLNSYQTVYMPSSTPPNIQLTSSQ